MKQRLLAFLLSAAMIATSVQTPVYATGTGTQSDAIVVEEETLPGGPEVIEESVDTDAAGIEENEGFIEDTEDTAEVMADAEAEKKTPTWTKIEKSGDDYILTYDKTDENGAVTDTYKIVLTPTVYHYAVRLDASITSGQTDLKLYVEAPNGDSNTYALKKVDLTSDPKVEADSYVFGDYYYGTFEAGSDVTFNAITLRDSKNDTLAVLGDEKVTLTTIPGLMPAYMTIDRNTTYKSAKVTVESRCSGSISYLPTDMIGDENIDWEYEDFYGGRSEIGLTGLRANTEYTVILRDDEYNELSEGTFKTKAAVDSVTAVQSDAVGDTTSTTAKVNVKIKNYEGSKSDADAKYFEICIEDDDYDIVGYKLEAIKDEHYKPENPAPGASDRVAEIVVPCSDLAPALNNEPFNILVYECDEYEDRVSTLYKGTVEISTKESVYRGTTLSVEPVSGSSNLKTTITLPQTADEAPRVEVKWRISGEQDGVSWNRDWLTPSDFSEKKAEYVIERLTANTKYDVMAVVDGNVELAPKTATTGYGDNAIFVTLAAAESYMQGAGVSATIKNIPAINAGTYTMQVSIYNKNSGSWDEVSIVVPNEYDRDIYSYSNSSYSGGSVSVSPADVTTDGVTVQQAVLGGLFYDQNKEYGYPSSSGTRVIPNAENRWKITIKKDNSVIFSQIVTTVPERDVEILPIEVGSGYAKFKIISCPSDTGYNMNNYVQVYAREVKGEGEYSDWELYNSNISAGKGAQFKAQGLEGGKTYEVRLSNNYYDDAALSNTVTVEIPADKEDLDLVVGDVRMRSADIKCNYHGNNDDPNVMLYLNMEGEDGWKIIDGGKQTGLIPGTKYKVCAELKSSYTSAKGKDVITSATASFTTKSANCKLEGAAEAIDEASASVKISVKSDVKLDGTFIARIGAKGVSGSFKDVRLSSENGYADTVEIEGLAAGTEYTIIGDLARVYDNNDSDTDVYVSSQVIDTVKTKVHVDPTSLKADKKSVKLNLAGDFKDESKNPIYDYISVTPDPADAKYMTLTWDEPDGLIAQVGTGTIKPDGTERINIPGYGTVSFPKEKKDTAIKKRYMAKKVGTGKISVYYTKEGSSSKIEADKIDVEVVDYRIMVDAGEGKDPVTLATYTSSADYLGGTTGRLKTGDVVPFVVQSIDKDGKKTAVPADKVTWSVDNLSAAQMDAKGTLTAGTSGKVTVKAVYDGFTMETSKIDVDSIVQKITIDTPTTSSGRGAIEGDKADYIIAAGTSYEFPVIVSPAYTKNGNTRVDVKSDALCKFTYQKSDAASATAFNYDSFPTSLAAGTYEIKATYGSDPATALTDSIKVEIREVPDTFTETYAWLSDAELALGKVPVPAGWKFDKEDTPIYRTGVYGFWATYKENDKYPLKSRVDVYVNDPNKVYIKWTYKEAAGTLKKINDDNYYVKTAQTGEVTPSVMGLASSGTYDGVLAAIAMPKATPAADITISAVSGNPGTYSVKPGKDNKYTVTSDMTLANVVINQKTGGGYEIVAGSTVKTVQGTFTLYASEALPISKIALDNTKNVSETLGFEWVRNADGKYDLVYRIDGTKNKALTSGAKLKVTLDIFTLGNENKVPPVKLTETAKDQIIAESMDESIVKATANLDCTVSLEVPANAEGYTTVTVSANDALGTQLNIPVWIKDYTARELKTYSIKLNAKKAGDQAKAAEIVIPYEDTDNGITREFTLVDGNSDSAKTVPGVVVEPSYGAGSTSHSYDLYVRIADKEKAKVAKKKTYYIKYQTKMMTAPRYIPVAITFIGKTPTVTVKQTDKVNLFYKNTVDDNVYAYGNYSAVTEKWDTKEKDGAAMGTITFKVNEKNARIDRVVWKPKTEGSSEFVIMEEGNVRDKNNYITYTYSIRQNDPVLAKGNKLADKGSAEGTMYIYITGYSDPVAKKVKIGTTYRKPKFTSDVFYMVPDLGRTADSNSVFTDLYATKPNKVSIATNKANPNMLARYFSASTTSGDAKVSIDSGTKIKIEYTGKKKSATVPVAFYSDYWREPVVLSAKVKSVKVAPKLAPATLTLNINYNAEDHLTQASSVIMNGSEKKDSTKTRSLIDFDSISVSGDTVSSALLGQAINIRPDIAEKKLIVTVNRKDLAANGTKAGSYKFDVEMKKGDATFKTKLTVKLIDKPAGVNVKTSGSIDLTKNRGAATTKAPYYYKYISAVKVTPKFVNVNTDYRVNKVTLKGAYSDQFTLRDSGGIAGWDADGTAYITRNGVMLVSGKSYRLTLEYELKDAGATGGSNIKVESKEIIVKPKQSKPGAAMSPSKVTLISTAMLNDGAALATRTYFNKAYTTVKISDQYRTLNISCGEYDLDNDGVGDIDVQINGGTNDGKGNKIYTIEVWMKDPDAVRATAKGYTYNIPVTFTYTGYDNVNKKTGEVTKTLKVIVKK